MGDSEMPAVIGLVVLHDLMDHQNIFLGNMDLRPGHRLSRFVYDRTRNRTLDLCERRSQQHNHRQQCLEGHKSPMVQTPCRWILLGGLIKPLMSVLAVCE